MTYRIIYDAAPTPRGHRPTAAEEFAHEHQALNRARELIESGEYHGVALDDGAGNLLCGVRLQWRLGGFTGE